LSYYRTNEKKETRQEKREMKAEWEKNREALNTVVLPTLAVLAVVVLIIIFYGTR